MEAGASLSRALFAVLLTGCVIPQPFSVDEITVARQLAPHFDAVYPRQSAGLIRPRFGIPAILETSTSFPIDVLELGAPRAIRAALIPSELEDRCVDLAPCVPLSLVEDPSTAIAAATSLRHFTATTPALDPRSYDLVLFVDGRQEERVPRAVFVRKPSVDRHELSVIQLSDLHLGRPGQVELVAQRLKNDVREVNALHPDVVLVTGDMAEEGHTLGLELWAERELLQIDAPVIVTLGNHDYGHWPRIRHPENPDRGYYNFARAFHALRLTRTTIGAWDLVGFDSGPSTFSLRIITRGITPETERRLAEIATENEKAGRGTIFFSHAPTRSELSSNPHDSGSRTVGTMYRGGEALEHTLLGGTHRYQLAGHTHWSDVFVGRDRKWSRIPFSELACPQPLGDAAIVNAPSATRITFPHVKHANAYGFVHLSLRDHDSLVQFVLYDGAGRPLVGTACKL